jgi:Zn2+/Cd2+-exporting ATPase
MNKVILKVSGMCCVDEVNAIKKQMKAKISSDRLNFDLISEKLTIDITGIVITDKEIIQIIKKSGFTAILWSNYIKRANTETLFEKYKFLCLSISSFVFLLLGYTYHAYKYDFIIALSGGEYSYNHSYPLLTIILYCVSIILGGWVVFPKAIIAILRFRADMNLLMVIAVIGAILLQQWFEAAAVCALFSLALLLESWSIGKARNAINSLMSLAPDKASIYTCCNKIIEKSLKDISVGTICIVKPGEKIAFDGKIINGSTYINEAPITGESTPVQKSVDDNVYAGTINGDSSIEFKIEKEAKDSTLSRIIGMIEDAQSKRAKTERWIEKFAAKYTPTMILIAIFIAIVPPLFFHGDWTRWIYESLVILVIACPCALVISTPVSIVAGLSSSARNGVLIKGGVYLEAPYNTKVIAFDKTGTLTNGKPSIINIITLGNHSEEQIVSTAASLEMYSSHPLAKAIMSYTIEKNIDYKKPDAYKILPGKGAEGVIDEKYYWIGSHKYLHERLNKKEVCLVHDIAKQFESKSQSIIVIGCEDHICGLISVSDRIKPEAKSVIQALKDLNIKKIIMLTGDNTATAAAVARELDIDFKAELLPDEKVNYVTYLASKYNNIVMVGDGINDAPAMAKANYSIAMGTVGSDVAIETADIALMSDDLTKIPWLINHSKRVINIVKQNIYFAVGIKIIFISLAITGFATLWMAIAADMGASLLVIFNGLRLLKIK